MTTRAPVGAAGARQMLDGHRKRARRNREIEERPLRVAERLPDAREGLEVAVVARHVLQQRREPRERGLVDGAARRHALAHALDQLLAGHRQPSDADDRHVQLPAGDERLQRRKDFLVREIAGHAEDDQRVGTLGRGHLRPAYTVREGAACRALPVAGDTLPDGQPIDDLRDAVCFCGQRDRASVLAL